MRMPLVSLLALCLLAPVTCFDLASPALAQGGNSELDPALATATLATRIGEHVQHHHELGQFSGAVLVADDGKVIYRGAFGLANSDWGIENQPDTKFRIASISKQFTAMLVLRLVDDGKLELEAPIRRYLPNYPGEAGMRVTVHHLLNHTSGIPSYTDRPDFMKRDAYHRYSRDEFIERFCSGPLQFEPGSQFQYNNSGYYLLGAIVEAVTEQSFASALRYHVLDPLGLNDTGYGDVGKVIPNRATGYDELLGERRVARYIDLSNADSAGALYSTVDDLWRWSEALREKRLLSGPLEGRMHTPGLATYAYGWFSDVRQPERPLYWHGGQINGFTNLISRVPATGRCLILLCNSTASEISRVARGIEDILSGRSPRPAAERIEITLARTALSGDVDAALAALQAAAPDSSRREEIAGELRPLGYRLLGQGRTDDAIALFRFATRGFPEHATLRAALGEAYVEAKERTLARESFERALELEPSHEVATSALAELEANPAPEKAPPPPPVEDPYFMPGDDTSELAPAVITRNLVRDSDGQLWLAGWSGIVRYDGETFTNVTNRKQLTRYRAFSTLRDRSGNLWFGTCGAGLYRYDGRSFTHYTTQDGLVGNVVLVLTEDRAGNIWCGTTEGLSRFDGTQFHNLTTEDGLPHPHLTAILEDRDGIFWLGTRGDTVKYDGKNFSVVRRPDGTTFDNARAIVEDRSGTVWIGGNPGLWSHDGSAWIQYGTAFVGSLLIDSGGNLWASVMPEGDYNMQLYRFRGTPSLTEEPTLIAAPPGQVFGLIEDPDGRIWFGTERGPAVTDGTEVRTFHE